VLGRLAQHARLQQLDLTVDVEDVSWLTKMLRRSACRPVETLFAPLSVSSQRFDLKAITALRLKVTNREDIDWHSYCAPADRDPVAGLLRLLPALQHLTVDAARNTADLLGGWPKGRVPPCSVVSVALIGAAPSWLFGWLLQVSEAGGCALRCRKTSAFAGPFTYDSSYIPGITDSIFYATGAVGSLDIDVFDGPAFFDEPSGRMQVTLDYLRRLRCGRIILEPHRARPGEIPRRFYWPGPLEEVHIDDPTCPWWFLEDEDMGVTCQLDGEDVDVADVVAKHRVLRAGAPAGPYVPSRLFALLALD
jgi:hypothetical protein